MKANNSLRITKKRFKLFERFFPPRTHSLATGPVFLFFFYVNSLVNVRINQFRGKSVAELSQLQLLIITSRMGGGETFPSLSWTASGRLLLVYSHGGPRLYNSISSPTSIELARPFMNKSGRFREQVEERFSIQHYRRDRWKLGEGDGRKEDEDAIRAGRRWGTDEKGTYKRTFEFSRDWPCIVCKTGEGWRIGERSRKKVEEGCYSGKWATVKRRRN